MWRTLGTHSRANAELKVLRPYARFQAQRSFKSVLYLIQYVVHVSSWTTFQAHKSFLLLILANGVELDGERV